MIENRVAHQALRIRGRETVEIVDQFAEHVAVQAGRLAGIRAIPLAHDARDDHQPLVGRGQREMQARRKLLEFIGERHFIAHQDDGAGNLVVALSDVLQQPDIHRFFEIGMEIEQHIDARHRCRLQMLQQLFRIREHALRTAEIDVDALQTLGDSPLEHAPAAAFLHLEAHFAHQVEHARFFARLHHDERQTRRQHRLQLAARVLGRGVVHAGQECSKTARPTCSPPSRFFNKSPQKAGFEGRPRPRVRACLTRTGGESTGRRQSKRPCQSERPTSSR